MLFCDKNLKKKILRNCPNFYCGEKTIIHNYIFNLKLLHDKEAQYINSIIDIKIFLHNILYCEYKLIA